MSDFQEIESPAPLELIAISPRCGDGSCPTIYRSTRGTFVVQGSTIAAEDAGIELGPGESLVEIPEDVARWLAQGEGRQVA